MTIRPQHSATIILVEDKGTFEFLKNLRSAVDLGDVRFEVGGGWTRTYQRYEELIQAVPPAKIVPVLDADTITDKPPKARAIVHNPNRFRFSKDFEWAFSNWMLADAISKLLRASGLPLDLRAVAITADLESLLADTRRRALQESAPLYSVLRATFADWLSERDVDPAAFPLPEKVPLAAILGMRLAELQILPPEIRELVELIQRVTGGPPLRQRRVRTPSGLSTSNMALTGRLLLTVNNRLHLCRLEEDRMEPFGPEGSLYYASWAPDRSRIAAVAVRRTSSSKRRILLILSSEGTVLREIDQGVPTGGPDEPCWERDGQALLVKHNGPVMAVTSDGERWASAIDANTGSYCRSSDGFCARTIQGEKYGLEIGRSWANGSAITGARDVRGRISWSHDGQRLAYPEYQLVEDRGCVVVMRKDDRRPVVITPLAWSPYWLSWSPDDRFIAFSCIGGSGSEPLRAVDVSTGEVRSMSEVRGEIVMGCRAWAA